MCIGLLGDQREVPLGVGVAEHDLGIWAKLLIQPRQLTEAAVVRHDAAVHGEGVSVEHRPSASARQALIAMLTPPPAAPPRARQPLPGQLTGRIAACGLDFSGEHNGRGTATPVPCGGRPSG